MHLELFDLIYKKNYITRIKVVLMKFRVCIVSNNGTTCNAENTVNLQVVFGAYITPINNAYDKDP